MNQILRKCILKKDCDLLRHNPKTGQEVYFDQQATTVGHQIFTIGAIGSYHLGFLSWGQIIEYLTMTGETKEFVWTEVTNGTRLAANDPRFQSWNKDLTDLT